jgi:hypothetical protein
LTRQALKSAVGEREAEYQSASSRGVNTEHAGGSLIVP